MNRRILIVEDEVVTAKVFSKKLETRGFDVLVLNSGTDVLSVVKEKNVELVLLDIMMPGVSGQDVLKQLRQEYQAFQLPIIMVTAKEEVSDVVEALNNGASDYITKPANIGVAEARIKTQLSLKDFYEDSLKKKQIESLNAMITTYNHQLNNPLQILVSNFPENADSVTPEKLKRAQNAIDRIIEIVRKINSITTEDVELESYVGDTKMVKLK